MLLDPSTGEPVTAEEDVILHEIDGDDDDGQVFAAIRMHLPELPSTKTTDAEGNLLLPAPSVFQLVRCSMCGQRNEALRCTDVARTRMLIVVRLVPIC